MDGRNKCSSDCFLCTYVMLRHAPVEVSCAVGLQPPHSNRLETCAPTALPAKRGQIGKKWEYSFSRTNPVILPFAALTEKTKLSGRDASSEAARSCRAAVGRSAQRWRSIMMPPSEEQHSCAQRVPVKHKRGACCLSLSVNMPFPPRPPPGSSRYQNNRRSRRVSFNGKKMQ